MTVIIITIETIPAINQTYTEYDAVASASNTFGLGLAVVIFAVASPTNKNKTK